MGRVCSIHGMTTNEQDIFARNHEGRDQLGHLFEDGRVQHIKDKVVSTGLLGTIKQVIF
jgi:hypothetical protein